MVLYFFIQLFLWFLEICAYILFLEVKLFEQYLQEYFGQILRKLKEVNYQQSQRKGDISFL